MTTQEIDKYFAYHNQNIKLLKIGFDHIREQIKTLYKAKSKNGDYIFSLADTDPEKISYKKVEKSLSRILSGIQVSWAEESIKRLPYENGLFTERQRQYLLERPALDQRWYCTLKIVFSIAYDLVPVNDEICASVTIESERGNLGDELVDNYQRLWAIITNNLVPSFSIRNKVQHGEWEFAFKPRFSAEFSQEITDKLNRENIITTTSRYTLINAIYQMIVDLGRFRSNKFALDSMLTPFEYFYKAYMSKIDFEVSKINAPALDRFITECIEKQKRGQQHKNNVSRN